MIRFAVINRARDGLALSASTDMDTGLDLVDSKKSVKLLAKKARQFPTKCFMKIGRFKIYFLTENDICCLLICEELYASVLAFSYLDNLRREFLDQYPKQAIEKAIRPYSFIEFDNFIQRTKQKYNNTRSLAVRIDLAELTEELQRNPPYEITDANFIGQPRRKSDPVSSRGPPSKLVPLSWPGIISCSLSLFCALLNLIRVVPFVSEHGNEPQEEAGWMVKGTAFFLSGCINIFQCYLLMQHVTRRQLLNLSAIIVNILLIITLMDLRNVFQISFHLVVSVLISVVTWYRPIQGKLPDYNV